MNRVVVTGLGPISSIGTGVVTFRESLRVGRSGISPISSFDTSGFPHICAGEVQDFRPENWIRRLNISSWGRTALFAAAAARLAIADAALEIDAIDRNRVSVVMGTTCGESQAVENFAAAVLRRDVDRLQRRLIQQIPAHRIAHAVSEELEIAGESLTLSTACAASNYAIGYAYDSLVNGEAEIVIAGGAESVCRWVHAGFYRLGILAQSCCAPFDRNRGGLLTAEGGAALVLETLDHAVARGARVYAEVLGYAANCDAFHPVAADIHSVANCMRLAHERSSIHAADVDYICAHGTGTPANDLTEANAIREVFAPKAPFTSSIKSMLGHTMGAASAFGAIASALAIADGFLPPTINWHTEDEALAGLNLVRNETRAANVRVAQNNGFGFGGNNAILILGKL